jgi:hypothetical protein
MRIERGPGAFIPFGVVLDNPIPVVAKRAIAQFWQRSIEPLWALTNRLHQAVEIARHVSVHAVVRQTAAIGVKPVAYDPASALPQVHSGCNAE